MAVGDAYRLFPAAHWLYHCDAAWWDVHHGCPDFTGEKWSSTGDGNDKTAAAKRHGLKLIAGRHREGFCLAPGIIHYGSNSGFQAINLALQFGCRRLVLVGFDMTRGHFFGEHPQPLIRNNDYRRFVPHFKRAAEMLPQGTEIINATPGSALTCFPYRPLSEMV